MTELLELKKNKARPHLSNSVAARRLPVSGDASGGALGAKNDSGVGWGGFESRIHLVLSYFPRCLQRTRPCKPSGQVWRKRDPGVPVEAVKAPAHPGPGPGPAVPALAEAQGNLKQACLTATVAPGFRSRYFPDKHTPGLFTCGSVRRGPHGDRRC